MWEETWELCARNASAARSTADPVGFINFVVFAGARLCLPSHPLPPCAPRAPGAPRGVLMEKKPEQTPIARCLVETGPSLFLDYTTDQCCLLRRKPLCEAPSSFLYAARLGDPGGLGFSRHSPNFPSSPRAWWFSFVFLRSPFANSTIRHKVGCPGAMDPSKR